MGESPREAREHIPVALVLGIDAAWTEHGSSAVALLHVGDGRRSVVAVAPSYAGFIGLGRGEPAEWRHPPGGVPLVSDLLGAAAALGGGPVDIVAVDMPLSRRPILGRRNADQAVSRAFGRHGAAVHSPAPDRPDKAVTGMARDFEAAGFQLATTRSRPPSLIEVYPLAALVRLLRAERRPAYKVSKVARYRWPGDISARIDRLLLTWRSICDELEREVGKLGIDFPERSFVRSASQLKPYEDAIDAVISAWVGACFLDGTAEPFPADDPDAAIWIPAPSALAR
jgi:predicted RNase H-like nuclease